MSPENNVFKQIAADETTPQDKVSFLKNTLPFNSLGDTEREELSKGMDWERFSPGDVIARQGVQGKTFYVIRSGLVKVYLLDEEGKETVLGFLGEGDCFGEISLLTQGPTTSNVQSLEDTLCLVQKKENFLAMTQKHPLFLTFFNQLLTQRMRSVYKELLSENPGISQVEPFLFRKQVKEMLSPSEAFIQPTTTIQDASRKIVEQGLDMLVVVDAHKKPQGVLKPNGILRSLLDGRSPGDPVEAMMDRSFISTDARSYFFDALYEMIKHRTQELVVLDNDQYAGVLTGFDLLRFRGREVLSLARNIEDAPDTAHLNALRQDVEKVLRALMTDGALASHACKIVSEFNDRMVRRVIRLAEMESGPPPSPYVWLGLGSEGRKEQTLLTDQDNAVLYSGPPSEGVREYFRTLSAKVVQELNACGFPLCKGGVMATQPKWFGDLHEWKTRASEWIAFVDRHRENLSDLYTFLDFRSVSGDKTLERELKSHVLQLIMETPSFLKSLAENIVSIPIPLGFFKNFIVEKSGKHKDTLNLKMYGLVPLITCIKLLALSQGQEQTNTLERISALTEAKLFTSDQREMLEQAFETFLTLKIRNNLNEMEQGKEMGNYINPAELSTRQKQLLKESFGTVSQLQKTTRSILKVQESELGGFRS
jgi:CBS domain-containing protein